MVKGEGEVAGLTDNEKPRRLGPKRAAHIKSAFVLRKNDDVRKYVVRREIKRGDKTFYKSARIQRLVTEKRVRRKVLNKRTRVDAWKKNKEAHVAYEKLLSKYLKEKKAAKKAADPTPAPVVEKKAPPKKVEAPKAKAAPAKGKAAPPKKVEAPPAPKKEEKKGGKKGGKK